MDVIDRRPRSNWVGQLALLSRSVQQLLAARLLDDGLSDSKFAILDALANSSVPRTQIELAAALGFSESTLCSLVEQLRRDQLLTRQRSRIDRRKTLLEVTERGQARYHRVVERQQALASELCSRMSPTVAESVPAVMAGLLQSAGQLEANDFSQRRAA